MPPTDERERKNNKRADYEKYDKSKKSRVPSAPDRAWQGGARQAWSKRNIEGVKGRRKEVNSLS